MNLEDLQKQESLMAEEHHELDHLKYQLISRIHRVVRHIETEIYCDNI
jgi:hypothetical protein